MLIGQLGHCQVVSRFLEDPNVEMEAEVISCRFSNQ